jgi:presenilin-like A22 family membrane protease
MTFTVSRVILARLGTALHMFSFRCQHYEKVVHSGESFISIHYNTFKISHVGAIFMIFKNQKRAILTEMWFIFVTAVISALFFTDVLQLDKRHIGIIIIIYCVYGIIVSSWFEEWHIQEDFFLTKCFYYDKKIEFREINYILYKKSSICLCDQNNNVLHTLSND